MKFLPMMRAALACALVFFSVHGHAGFRCNGSDRWIGEDKQLHFAGGAVLGGFITAGTQSPMRGFMWGAGLSVGAEVLDGFGAGHCSVQDMAAGVLGAALGSYAVGWNLRRMGKTTMVTYTWPLD